MIIQAIRSLLFYVLYFSQTAILAIFIGGQAVIMRRRTRLGWALVRYWGASTLFLLRWIVGIRTRVTGAENIPVEPCIIAAKHMSDWDIFAILPYPVRPAFVAKRQLVDMPFFGWAAKCFDTIRIDRSLRGDAIPLMIADALVAKERGCQIVIFPEGTRKAPLAAPDYRRGTARIYAALGVPVVPVALNSGLFWGRRGLILWPGTAEAKILPPIEPGLPPEQFRDLLTDTIEAATTELVVAAYERGLTRPIPPDLREKLEAARAEVTERRRAQDTIS